MAENEIPAQFLQYNAPAISIIPCIQAVSIAFVFWIILEVSQPITLFVD